MVKDMDMTKLGHVCTIEIALIIKKEVSHRM